MTIPDPFVTDNDDGAEITDGTPAHVEHESPTVYVADDPADTLWHASIGPRWTPAYQEAVDRDDWDEIERLEAEQDALAEALGEAWLAAAERVGQKLGVKVDAIISGGSVADDHLALNEPDFYGERPSQVNQVWQEAHDLVGVEVHDDGTWKITD